MVKERKVSFDVTRKKRDAKRPTSNLARDQNVDGRLLIVLSLRLFSESGHDFLRKPIKHPTSNQDPVLSALQLSGENLPSCLSHDLPRLGDEQTSEEGLLNDVDGELGVSGGEGTSEELEVSSNDGLVRERSVDGRDDGVEEKGSRGDGGEEEGRRGVDGLGDGEVRIGDSGEEVGRG